MARLLTGIVTSDKMEKTVTVAVDQVKQHPVYRKQYKVTRKFLAHDENSRAQVGDKVQLKEVRPLSRRKRWTVDSVVEQAPGTKAKKAKKASK